MKLKYFSFASGVAGLELGFPKDWECVGFAEIDKYASAVLRYHFHNVKNYGDVYAIKWKEISDFDLLSGGTPCQDLSISGKRAGLAGARSRLFFEFIRALKEKKPKYFIWENVKGALSSNGGFDFARVLLEFSEAGYNLWWQVLNAKDFGVPQNRERIFIVGFREGSPPEVFFEPENSEKANELQEQAVNTITTRYRASQAVGTYVIENQQHAQNKPIEITKNQAQGYRVYSTEGIAIALRSNGGGEGGKTGLYQISSKQIRRLTPVECERLMGWKDNWTRYGIDEKGNKFELSDTQRYRLIGNGVVSNVVKEIVDKVILWKP